MGDFKDNVEKLSNKKIKIDIEENIRGYYPSLVDAVKNYNEKTPSTFLSVLIHNTLYHIYKSTAVFTKNFIYQFNNIYNKEYSNYHIFLNILFIGILTIISIIFYWDNIYRTAKQTSRCQTIQNIYEENENSDDPFTYYIIIIDKENVDTLEKYIMRIEYNFSQKRTRIEMGDEQYTRDVFSETPPNVFNYYDIENMNKLELQNINVDLITNVKYKYVTVNSRNQVVKTDAGNNLAVFTRKYAKNSEILLYPIYDIMNAYKMLSIV